MALHGVPKEELNKIRREFEAQDAENQQDQKVSLADFQNVGLKFGKPNTTRVIRAEHKETKNG